MSAPHLVPFVLSSRTGWLALLGPGEAAVYDVDSEGRPEVRVATNTGVPPAKVEPGICTRFDGASCIAWAREGGCPHVPESRWLRRQPGEGEWVSAGRSETDDLPPEDPRERAHVESVVIPLMEALAERWTEAQETVAEIVAETGPIENAEDRRNALRLLESIEERGKAAALRRSTAAFDGPTPETRTALLELFQNDAGELSWYREEMTAAEVRKALETEIGLAADGIGEALSCETGDDLMSALSWVRNLVAVLATLGGDGAEAWRNAALSLKAANMVRVGWRSTEERLSADEASVPRAVLRASMNGEVWAGTPEEVAILAAYLRNAGVRP